MHPCDPAAFIDGGQGLLPLGNLTKRNGGGSHGWACRWPPVFARSHLGEQNGITVIHKHFVV